MKDKQFKFELLPNDIKESRFGFISIEVLCKAKQVLYVQAIKMWWEELIQLLG